MKELTIYLAGPISGLPYEEITHRYSYYVPKLEALGFNVMFPMAAKGYLRNESRFESHGYNDNPITTDRAIVGRDRWMVNQSDIVIADLSNAKIISMGTLFEIAWGHLMGKYVIIVMKNDNIHQHSFVLESSDATFDTMEDVLAYLKDFSSGLLAL